MKTLMTRVMQDTQTVFTHDICPSYFANLSTSLLADATTYQTDNRPTTQPSGIV